LLARYANELEALYTPVEVISRHEVLIALLESGEPGPLEAGILHHYIETVRRMTAAVEQPVGIVCGEINGNTALGEEV
jgi:hypothetical protein